MRWTLRDYLTRHNLTPYQLAKTTGLSVNTVYPLARGEAQRVSLETLQTVLDALDELTGQRVELADVLERSVEPEPVDLTEVGLADYKDALDEIDADVDPDELREWYAAFERDRV